VFTLKRRFGNFVVAGLLAGGAAVGMASPSSAMPRDPCMDVDNYLTRVGWLTDSLNYYAEVEAAWENPTRTWDNNAWDWRYKAFLPNNHEQVVIGADAYNSRLQSATMDYNVASNRLVDFTASTVVC
jgi:1,4-alpha-glucan branching enzyme